MDPYLAAAEYTKWITRVFTIVHEANWKEIHLRKATNVLMYKEEKNNTSSIQTPLGDKVLMQQTKSTRKLERPYDGPYEITEVFTYELLRYRKE